LIFWVALTGIVLYFSLRDVDLRVVWGTLGRTDLGYLTLALISMAVNTWGKAARWQVFLGEPGRRVGFRHLLVSLLVGQTLNWFLPGRLGDLGRVYLVGTSGIGRSYALATVVLEKILDLLLYAILFFFTLIIFPLPTWVSGSIYTLTALALLLTAAVIVVARQPAWFLRQLERVFLLLPKKLGKMSLPRLQAGLASLEILKQGTDLARLALWSLIIWVTAVWTNHLTAQALGIQLPVVASLVVLVVLLAGVSIPSVPGRIGVFQYLCILSLALFQIDRATGLTYGILLQIIVVVPTALASLVIMTVMNYHPLDFKSRQTLDFDETPKE
jgi:hypothetical protein